jgi:hypothetical protein
MMWRFLVVPLCLSLSPLSMADVAARPVIENFFHDPVPLLEPGEDAVSVRFYWQALVKNCQLVMDEHSIDVSSVSAATVNVPETMDVRLRCGAAEVSTHIQLRKKLAIVSLTVEPSPAGKMIRWEAFGAESCRIRDDAKQLDLRDLPAIGHYIVKEAVAPLFIQLNCEDGRGLTASARFSEFRSVNREQNLLAKAAGSKKK